MSDKIDIEITQKNTIDITVFGLIILVIVTLVLSFAETGSLLGVGIGILVGILGFVFSFVGLVPFGIGAWLYVTLVWNWIIDNTTKVYNLNMPVTLFFIHVMTILLVVIWTVITTITTVFFVIAWIAD